MIKQLLEFKEGKFEVLLVSDLLFSFKELVSVRLVENDFLSDEGLQEFEEFIIVDFIFIEFLSYGSIILYKKFFCFFLDQIVKLKFYDGLNDVVFSIIIQY